MFSEFRNVTWELVLETWNPDRAAREKENLADQTESRLSRWLVVRVGTPRFASGL